MTEMEPIVRANKLNVGYGQTSILNGLDFDIYKGDMICLMGHNGCGKSTLLKTLANLIPKLDGLILLNDKNIEEYSTIELAKLISVVLTERMDLPGMNVFEVVALGRYPYTNLWGKLTEEDKRVVDDAILTLEIESLKNKHFQTLSDGQKQKVLIARALAQDTDIIYFDEPTTYLDIQGRMEILKVLKKIALEKKKAILFSSHDWHLVLSMTNWVWIVDKEGKLTKGVPEDLVLNGLFEKSFSSSSFEFDKSSGGFKVSESNLFEIKLVGDNENYLYWTKHLLSKNRIGTTINGTTDKIIEVIEKGDKISWIFKDKNVSKTTDSLEKLLVFLKS